MPNYGRTAYFLDDDAIRMAVATEVGVRGISYREIEEQTGVLAVGIGRFLNPDRKATLHVDGLLTLIKWAGLDVNRFVKRRRTVARHTDTYEQRQLRKAAAYLESQGVSAEQGETAVDALMRLVASAKENGFLS